MSRYGFKATADGSTLLILDVSTGATSAFTAGLRIGPPRAVPPFFDRIGTQAPQILVTAANAFYTELSIGIDTDPGSGMKVRPAADGSGTVEVDREQTGPNLGKFTSVAVELKGNVTAGEIWTLQLRNVWRRRAVHHRGARYTTKFGDTLSNIAAALGAQLNPALYDVIVRGRVITISNALASQNQDIDARVLVGLARRTDPDQRRWPRAPPARPPWCRNWCSRATQLDATPQTVTVMAIDDTGDRRQRCAASSRLSRSASTRSAGRSPSSAARWSARSAS